LEFEFDGAGTSDEDRMLEGETQVADPSTTSDSSALPVTAYVPHRNRSSRRKAIVGATAGFVLVAAIALMAVNGGGKGETAPSQVVKGTTTIAQTAVPMTTGAPTASTTTTTEVIPTTTYEVLQCPYTRVIEAVDGKIVTPEGVTIEVIPGELVVEFGNFRGKTGWHLDYINVPPGRSHISISNQTNFRTRTNLVGEIIVGENRYPFTIPWEETIVNGFQVGVALPYNVLLEEPKSDSKISIALLSAEVQFNCP
jgi:hypothetical protein